MFFWKTSWLFPFAAMLSSKGILGKYLHHANMLNCRVCFTFPYPQTERPHAHMDYMINTRASVCHWSSEEKTDSRSISSPSSIPSVGIGFSSVQPPTLPLSHPHPTPLFPQIVTLSSYPPTDLVHALWRLDPLPFTHTPTPLCRPCCRPHLPLLRPAL